MRCAIGRNWRLDLERDIVLLFYIDDEPSSV